MLSMPTVPYGCRTGLSCCSSSRCRGCSSGGVGGCGGGTSSVVVIDLVDVCLRHGHVNVDVGRDVRYEINTHP